MKGYWCRRGVFASATSTRLGGGLGSVEVLAALFLEGACLGRMAGSIPFHFCFDFVFLFSVLVFYDLIVLLPGLTSEPGRK